MGEQQPVVDAYGFAHSCTPDQLAARSRCDAKQARQAARWGEQLAAGYLPSGDRLKKLCRKVRRPAGSRTGPETPCSRRPTQHITASTRPSLLRPPRSSPTERGQPASLPVRSRARCVALTARAARRACPRSCGRGCGRRCPARPRGRRSTSPATLRRWCSAARPSRSLRGRSSWCLARPWRTPPSRAARLVSRRRRLCRRYCVSCPSGGKRFARGGRRHCSAAGRAPGCATGACRAVCAGVVAAQARRAPLSARARGGAGPAAHVSGQRLGGRAGRPGGAAARAARVQRARAGRGLLPGHELPGRAGAAGARARGGARVLAAGGHDRRRRCAPPPPGRGVPPARPRPCPRAGAARDARRAARAQASCTATRTRTTWWARTWRCARWRCARAPPGDPCRVCRARRFGGARPGGAAGRRCRGSRQRGSVWTAGSSRRQLTVDGKARRGAGAATQESRSTGW